MRYEDEIIDILPLDKEHREKWFSATGMLIGLDSDEREKTLIHFNDVLDNWELYKKYNAIYEFILPMVRRSIHYLYSDESMVWSIKSDSQRLKLFRLKFNLEDYFTHVEYLFHKNKIVFKNDFKNIDGEAELLNICIKDYFTRLSNESKSDDYTTIIRDININTIIE